MDEDQKKDSAGDRISQGLDIYQEARLLNRLSKGRLGRGVLSAARGVASAARGVGALAATSEIWGPIAIALGLVLFFTVTIVVITGGPGAASEINDQQQLTALPNTSTSSLFTTANNESGISDPDFYNVLKDAFSNSTYTSLVTDRGPFKVVFNQPLGDFVGCQATVDGRNTITFYGFSNCSFSHQKYLALHESGHIIGNKNGRLYQSFPHNDLRAQDARCYSRLGFLRSYFHAETGAGTNSKDESFAEAVALFLMPKERPPLTDFQNQCPNTYNWVRNNIFK